MGFGQKVDDFLRQTGQMFQVQTLREHRFKHQAKYMVSIHTNESHAEPNMMKRFSRGSVAKTERQSVGINVYRIDTSLPSSQKR